MNYLNTNNIELTSSLWPYAIHSFNQELIFLLLEKKVKPLSESFVKCSLDAIKCHNNELFEYIQNNLVNDAEKNNEEIVSKCIKCYNFAILDHHLINQSKFFDLCQYDYYYLVKLLMNDVDLNLPVEKVINHSILDKISIINLNTI